MQPTPTPFAQDLTPVVPADAVPTATPATSTPAKPRARWVAWAGIGCIVLSFALYGFFFVVPFLPVTGTFKTVLLVGSVVGGEALFAVGGLALGVQVVRRFRRYLNPVNWFRRAPKPAEKAEASA